MSVLTVSSIAISIEELVGTFEGIGTLVGGLSVTPAVVVVAGIAAVVVIGKLFDKIWNSTRVNIPGIEASLTNSVDKVSKLGNKIQDALTEWNLIKEEINSKNEFNNKIDGINIDIKSVINQLSSISDNLYDQLLEWASTLAIFYIAKNDNTFYTLNKNDVDTLINSYSSSDNHISTLEDTINKVLIILDNLINLIRKQYEINLYTVTTLVAPEPTTTIGDFTEEGIDEALRKGIISKYLASLLKSMIKSISISSTQSPKRKPSKGKKRKFKKKKQKKNRKQKEKLPQKIKMIWVKTYDVSDWIAKITFTFPIKKDLESDDKGTIMFHLKKGGTIRFVRVKRGTFSVIALAYGTGFRLWSQFWKKKLVNKPPKPKPVLSWFIKRINPQDRQIAIPQEIKNKKVKYK